MTSAAANLFRSPRAAPAQAPLRIHVPEDPGVRAAFTGRTGAPGPANQSLLVGDTSGTEQARTAALALVGATLDSSVYMQQVHGGDVAHVTPAAAGAGAWDAATAVPAVDGLVTRAEDLALVVLAADCVPLILVDPGQGVAAVHAGRGGVLSGVVPAAVAALAPGTAGSVVALIGPAIGGCCYEVPAAMAAEVGAQLPAAATITTWGTPSLDLPAAVHAQLVEAGVARVEHVAGCTRCSDGTWFSHRSTTAGHTPAGRQAGIVRRAPAGPPHPAATAPSLESRR